MNCMVMASKRETKVKIHKRTSVSLPSGSVREAEARAPTTLAHAAGAQHHQLVLPGEAGGAAAAAARGARPRLHGPSGRAPGKQGGRAAPRPHRRPRAAPAPGPAPPRLSRAVRPATPHSVPKYCSFQKKNKSGRTT